MKMKATLFTILFIGSSLYLFSQVGYSSGSLTMNRSKSSHSSYSQKGYNSKVNLGFTSDQVIIEEYLNYHRHNIPLPTWGGDISIDLRWGNSQLGADGTAILQIGIATNRLVNTADIPPLNVCLVIDRSGSMSGDRIEKVKKGALKFVEGLRPDDIISIVTYHDIAEVALAPSKAGDLSLVKNIISAISTAGSTNLNGGMVLGYEQVIRHYDKNSTNRVILLTDGLANKGEINSDVIIANSDSYNKKGIDISTIGVGSSVNFDLLHNIAKKGKGLNHFVGDVQEDIDKVFVDELESLLSPVAKDVTLEMTFPEGMEMVGVLGYSPEFIDHKISFHLDNMNRGLTQVILIAFKQSANNTSKDLLPFTASLNYFSVANKKDELINSQIDLAGIRQKKNEEYFSDNEVKKNYWIGVMAQRLKETARLIECSQEKTAKDLITDIVKETKKQFPQTTDADILRVKSILEDNVAKFN